MSNRDQEIEWTDQMSYERGRSSRATTIGSGMIVEEFINNICSEDYAEPHPRAMVQIRSLFTVATKCRMASMKPSSGEAGKTKPMN
jgi:hypothetical protein